MNMAARKEEYQVSVDTLNGLTRPRLFRKFKKDQGKLKLVEEYCALVEEEAARSYDLDRATQKAKFCDPDDPKGAMQLKGYTDMASTMSTRLEEIAPRIAELAKELGES